MQDNNEQQPPALPTQRRILATSVRGDTVWELSEPILEWMAENGDQELSDRAIATHMSWELNQGWFIEWGNSTGYFQLAELACRDLARFKEAVKLMPADNPGVQHIIDFALMTGEQFNKPYGIGRKNILHQRRKQRRGSKRR